MSGQAVWMRTLHSQGGYPMRREAPCHGALTARMTQLHRQVGSHGTCQPPLKPSTLAALLHNGLRSRQRPPRDSYVCATLSIPQEPGKCTPTVGWLAWQWKLHRASAAQRPWRLYQQWDTRLKVSWGSGQLHQQRVPLITSQNIAPIWLPHWSPWVWTSCTLTQPQLKFRENVTGVETSPTNNSSPKSLRETSTTPVRVISSTSQTRFPTTCIRPDFPRADGKEHLLSKLRNGQSTELLRTSRRERCEALHEEMKPRESNQIHGKLAEIEIQLSGKSNAPRHLAHRSGHKMVQVSVSWSRELQSAKTDVVQGLVVQQHVSVRHMHDLSLSPGHCSPTHYAHLSQW